MACPECERRRVETAILVAAGMEWIKNPTGPKINDIILRLRQAAIDRGEFDALPKD